MNIQIKLYWPIYALFFVFILAGYAIHDGWRIPQSVWVTALLAVVVTGLMKYCPSQRQQRHLQERQLRRPMARRIKR